MQKTAIIMCGMPGSGKTSWRKQFKDKAYVISTDDIVEQAALDSGRSYADTWVSMVDDLEAILIYQALEAKHHDIVIFDQTNLTREKRDRIKAIAGDDFRYVIADFSHVKFITLCERNAQRKLKGRDIPHEVMTAMYESKQHPTEEEGVILPFGRFSVDIPLINYKLRD